MQKEWFTVTRLSDNFLAIDDNGHDMIFLYHSDDQAVLFDTGFGLADLPALLEEFPGRFNVSAAALEKLLVLNTHGHPDHVFGNYQFSEVYIHPDDFYMSNGPLDRETVDFIRDRFCEGRFPDGFDEAAWAQRENPPLFLPPSPIVFSDFRIEYVHTPGHSPGSVAYLIKPANILLVGDTVVHGPAWLQLPESSTLEVYKQSVQEILALPDSDTRIFCSHSANPVPIDVIRRFPAFLDTILDGTAEGAPMETFAGNGTAYYLEKPYGVLVK